MYVCMMFRFVAAAAAVTAAQEVGGRTTHFPRSFLFEELQSIQSVVGVPERACSRLRLAFRWAEPELLGYMDPRSEWWLRRKV